MERREFLYNGMAFSASAVAAASATNLFKTMGSSLTKHKWKCFTLFSPELPVIGQSLVDLRNEIYEKSNGNIAVEFINPYENKDLMENPVSAINKLLSNEYQMAILTPFTLAHLNSEFNYYGQFPFSKTGQELEQWHRSPRVKAHWDYLFGQHNLKPFHFGRSDHGLLWSRKEIKNIEDLLGSKTRVMGVAKNNLQKLGARPQVSSYGSIRENVANFDVVEGFSPHIELQFGFGDSFKYAYQSEWPKKVSYMGLFINQSAYRSVGDENQTAIGAIVDRLHDKLADVAVKYNSDAIATLKARGVEIRNLPIQVEEKLKAIATENSKLVKLA
jgi:TRAP-type mannitol/chloroaromatic compound transport system substrate-binding protein